MRLGPQRKISNLSNYYNYISGLIMTSVNFSETLQEINQKLNGIEIVSSQVQELRNDLSAISSRIDSTVDKFSEDTSQLKKDYLSLQAELSATNVKLQRLENESKKCNLVLYNFDPTNKGSSLGEDVMRALNLHVPNLGLKMMDIRDIFRLNAKQGTRPVLVKFTSGYIRDTILRSSAHLKRAGLGVSPDYTKRELSIRNHLKPFLERARGENREARLRGTKLYIGQQCFTYSFDKQSVVEVTNSPNIESSASTMTHFKENFRQKFLREPGSLSVPQKSLVKSFVSENNRFNLEEPCNSRSRSGSSSSIQSFFSVVEELSSDNEINGVNSETPVIKKGSTSTFVGPVGAPKRNSQQIISPDDHLRQKSKSVRADDPNKMEPRRLFNSSQPIGSNSG